MLNQKKAESLVIGAPERGILKMTGMRACAVGSRVHSLSMQMLYASRTVLYRG
jgi:hypothetical protein